MNTIIIEFLSKLMVCLTIVCEAFRALLEARDQRDEAIRKRLMSKKWVVDRLVNPSYSKTEVIKMLDDAVYW